MRILALCRESYPMALSASYVLLHQSMALEELGHEIHLFNLKRPPLRLLDYLEAYEFDLIFLDVELLRSEELARSLLQFRTKHPVRVVGALYALPGPSEPAWESLDFCVTPWKGKTIETLARRRDIRYLLLGYNARLHRRIREGARLGAVFVGNITGDSRSEAVDYLQPLLDERVTLCIGPGFEQEYLDPFMLGQVYAASRCLPNFHYSWAKSDDCMLNERFWQTARCGVPVNDHSWLMDEVWDGLLVESFCFGDKRKWQDRVRALNAEEDQVEPMLLDRLDTALGGHSYTDRMKQLVDWLA